MTDDMKERLRGLDTIGGIGPMAAARITDLEARLAAAEADRDYWQKDSAAAWDKCEERRLQAVAAEAGEDALAEALYDVHRSLEHKGAQVSKRRIRAALAAYGARRG